MKGFVLGVALAVRPRKQVSGQKPKQKVTKTRRTAFEPQHCFENKTKHTKPPQTYVSREDLCRDATEKGCGEGAPGVSSGSERGCGPQSSRRAPHAP